MMIGGHAEDQVPGLELLEQSRTEPRGLGEMGMVREEPLILVENTVMKASLNNFTSYEQTGISTRRSSSLT